MNRFFNSFHLMLAMNRELDRLDRAIALQHILDEDIALARIPNSQGLGGASSAATQS